MLNTLFGWYCRTNLGCKFDTIVFSESIAANTTDYAVTLTSAQDGAAKNNKMTGYNFIVTSIYSVCVTGVVDAKVLPDNESENRFYVQLYQPITRELPVPLPLTVGISIVFDNNEAHINNAYLAFNGFWITESSMAKFTMLSELIPAALEDIDMQTLSIVNILAAMAAAEGVVVPEYEEPIYRTPREEFREFCKAGRRF